MKNLIVKELKDGKSKEKFYIKKDLLLKISLALIKIIQFRILTHHFQKKGNIKFQLPFYLLNEIKFN